MPWRFYLYKHVPARIWELRTVKLADQTTKIIAEIMYVIPIVVEEREIPSVRPTSCDLSELTKIDRWSNEHLHEIAGIFNPSLFLNPSSWKEFHPPQDKCGSVHAPKPVNYNMIDNEVFDHAEKIIKSVLGCCPKRIPGDLVKRYISYGANPDNQKRELVVQMLGYVGIDVSRK